MPEICDQTRHWRATSSDGGRGTVPGPCPPACACTGGGDAGRGTDSECRARDLRAPQRHPTSIDSNTVTLMVDECSTSASPGPTRPTSRLRRRDRPAAQVHRHQRRQRHRELRAGDRRQRRRRRFRPGGDLDRPRYQRQRRLRRRGRHRLFGGSNDPELDPDESLTVFVLSTIPAGASDGHRGRVDLTAAPRPAPARPAPASPARARAAATPSSARPAPTPRTTAITCRRGERRPSSRAPRSPTPSAAPRPLPARPSPTRSPRPWAAPAASPISGSASRPGGNHLQARFDHPRGRPAHRRGGRRRRPLHRHRHRRRPRHRRRRHHPDHHVPRSGSTEKEST